MIEYKMIGENNRPVTLDNIREVMDSIGTIFPQTDANERGLRKTYGKNGEAFHVYCGYSKPTILLPKEHEESIKERLEVLIGLKFEEVKCQ
jgi:hypothetical protein